MTNLRERRRLETARLIQEITTGLVRSEGFDAVTTEAIAHAAGISQRTFFNYYPNKEAAIFGEIPQFAEQDVQAFLTDTGPTRASLYRLMRAHTLAAKQSGDQIRLVVSLLQTQPRMVEIYMAQREMISGTLAELLAQRFGRNDTFFAQILAHSLLSTSWMAIRNWLEEKVPLEQAFDEAWEALSAVSVLIADAT